MLEAGIKDRDKYIPSTESLGCNYLSPPLMPASGTHYDDVMMTILASQITSLTVVYSIVYSGVDERKHQSSASLAFVQGIHRDR